VTAQTWNADVYSRNARFVSDLAMPVVGLLNPQQGERILDLGCGDGVLTRKLVDMGCELVGLDASQELAAAAQRLGLDIVVMDAVNMTFHEEFDAVFSNAVLHWIKDADRLIHRVFNALRPGGRFVAECGGYKCNQTIVTALVTELTTRGYDGESAIPWYFPAAEDYRSRLESRGFAVDCIEIIPRPTTLPGDISGFIETFGGSFTSLLPTHERAAYVESVRARLRPLLCSADGTWTADYTRLRFKARKQRAGADTSAT
jgi:trans-aconitate methyltransferase